MQANPEPSGFAAIDWKAWAGFLAVLTVSLGVIRRWFVALYRWGSRKMNADAFAKLDQAYEQSVENGKRLERVERTLDEHGESLREMPKISATLERVASTMEELATDMKETRADVRTHGESIAGIERELRIIRDERAPFVPPRRNQV